MNRLFVLFCFATIGLSTSLTAQPNTPPNRTFPTTFPGNEKSTEELINELIAHFDGGRYEKSLVLLQEAMQNNKEGRLSDILYYYRGLVYYKLKDYKAMLSSLDTAISFNPNKANYYYYRGEAFFTLGEIVKAQVDYKKSIELEPQYDAAWLRYGILLQQNNQIREALIAYDRAIQINARNMEAYYYHGLIMLQVGMPDKGCPELEQAANLGYRPAEKAMKQYCEE